MAMTKFTLPDKKVTLLPIIRRTSFMGSTDHDGLFMYTNTSMVWCIFKNSYGKYIDPLNDAERKYFEKEFPNENFNVNSKEHFWKSFTVKITKEHHDLSRLKREFDLSEPIDYLSYKLLLTAPDVANNYREKDQNYEYKWMIIEKGEEIQTTITEAKKKAKCYKWISENETKKNTLRDILWIRGVKVSSDNITDELLKLLYDMVEKPSEMKRLYEVITDEDLNTNILLTKFIKANFIIVKGNKYYDKSGELIANGKDAVFKWIADRENSIVVEQWKEDLKKLKL